ncbi:MAG: hypothetical protein DWQ58_09330 [Microcystis aeruginosa TA09]|nr:MAG: hypothetical protein DWQ58_09330 [Microcystis aeruginosa TA09]
MLQVLCDDMLEKISTQKNY